MKTSDSSWAISYENFRYFMFGTECKIILVAVLDICYENIGKGICLSDPRQFKTSYIISQQAISNSLYTILN